MLESLYHHIVLPSCLPGRQEGNLVDIEVALTERLLHTSKFFRDAFGESYNKWDCIRRSLQICKTLNAGGKLNKASLLTEFRSLERRDLIVLHIAEQNAGLLIHNTQGEGILFEAFEASLLRADVLASDHALQRDFPGCAVVIPVSQFDDASLQDNLAAFLEQASTESIKKFAAQARKAGSSVYESRDTADPALITQMLMTLLEANGRRTFPVLLSKRIRDDVCWSEGGEKPWRRSALWLTIRVGIQRHLNTLFGGEAGRVHYKFFFALFLARFLEETRGQLSPEILQTINTKLCRRLAKLEAGKSRASSTVRKIYEDMFTCFGPVFHKTIQGTISYIEEAWANFKAINRKFVPPLPLYAEQHDLYLSLPNSAAYLRQVLTEPLISSGRASRFILPTDCDVILAANKRSPNTFCHRYLALSKREAQCEELSHSITPTFGLNDESRCIELATSIISYLSAVGTAYDSNPEQKSIMILTILELWVAMDQCATRLFPLLTDYSPGFASEMLDVLQLPTFQDMCRLSKIQAHLHSRNATCNTSRMTIFVDPVKGCFAEAFSSKNLETLRERIEADAEVKRGRKEEEWQGLSKEYEDLIKVISESICVYTSDDFNPHIQMHDDKCCTKCYLQRKAKRIRIEAHEHPLPYDPVQVKAVLFEIGCPSAFAAYRDVTWRILGTLATPEQIQSHAPKLLLADYPELKIYANIVNRHFSLGSKTKSFLQTHFRRPSFPVGLEDVCLPNGLKLAYFDTLTQTWPGRDTIRPTFAHHCRIELPSSSPFSTLQLTPEFAPDRYGKSSYEIVESQTKCPPGLNVHEWMAYQSLYSGKARRWLSVLVELGSSNLNFSTEATTLLMSQIALQAGPSQHVDLLRTVHAVFHDEMFCKRLMEQLSQRLDGISSNWRETTCMEMLITLVLRLYSLARSSTIIEEVFKLLEKAREITFEWIQLLRIEIQNATDTGVSRRCSRHIMLAALLCKRTFAIYVKQDVTLEPTVLQYFIECSVTLQDNLVDDPTTLSQLSKNMLIWDFKMVSQIQGVLRRSIEISPQSLYSAISGVWPEGEGDIPRRFSELTFLPQPHEGWIRLTADASHQIIQQAVHYHWLEGHLFIDGKPLGKLPAEHRNSVILEQLFGKQSLSTYPSGLPGMTYRLAHPKLGHHVHIGFRNQALIVRACYRGAFLELIPNDKFRGPTTLDLPTPLIDKCVHWLDLRTGIIEIRQDPNFWRYKKNNWRLNFNTRLAQKHSFRMVSLINPQSSLFGLFARVFDKFELRQNLIVSQTEKRTLQVELRRLELCFAVNHRNLLQSSQLRSEIDPNQDAGTWYGLRSKLILRDAENPRKRSILVPLGPMVYERDRFHVSVGIVNQGGYARYTINDVLGRLDCPAEAWLLYLKAQLHAYTSFVLPDSLTGRTGTDEALHCLRSGYCQPWTPLNKGPSKCLALIAKLTPHRCFYPKDLKLMQEVSWDPQLPTSTQHDDFRPLVDLICRKSEQLSKFALGETEVLPKLATAGDPHLTLRSKCCRSMYERPVSINGKQHMDTPLAYTARDRVPDSQRRLNVFESVSLIRLWPAKMLTTLDLAGILQNWPNIDGFDQVYGKVLLSDRLCAEFPTDWGPLVAYCRNSQKEDKYQLMFTFAILSFENGVDMDMVRCLIAFSIFEDLKALDPPMWPSYVQFKAVQSLRYGYLLQLIKPCCLPYSRDERSTFQGILNPKQRRKLETMELAYEQQVDKDSKALADFLLSQWPCPQPVMEGFSQSPLIDMSRALDVIQPEWQRLFRNLELWHYIQDVQVSLDRHRGEIQIDPLASDSNLQEVIPVGTRGSELPTLFQNLLRNKGPAFGRSWENVVDGNTHQMAHIFLDNSSVLPRTEVRSSNAHVPFHKSSTNLQMSRDILELESIVNSFQDTQSHVRQSYARDMIQSLIALRNFRNVPNQSQAAVDPSKLAKKIAQARQTVQSQFHQIRESLEGQDASFAWLLKGGLFPSITPITLLENLRSTSVPNFGKDMKEGLVKYALSITHLQHLLRIDDAGRKGDRQKMHDELENAGHSNWRPLEYTDWLLLEIDANILIRPEQIDVALATISPSSKTNAVLQLNMGKGKTSCIMPMIAAVLADTKMLLRVVVPKPLLIQTAQLLHARLGGLLGREVRHIPFSRKSPTSQTMIESFYNLHNEILKSSGVMLALPEHILSFNLSGLQRLADARIPEAKPMVRVQAWFKKICRDVLDESDFTLAVRTQLIYPSGAQTLVDGYPHRWEATEAILRLVEGHLWRLEREFPQSIEIFRRNEGGFPVLFFLRTDVEDALITRLVQDVCSERTSIIPMKECTKSDRQVIREFLSEPKLLPSIAEKVRQLFPDNPAARKIIYLLRGLLVHRILLMTLKKRWNVQYGLHPKRDPIAVPFHAKGVPSEQAEWGHPDVAILFTCLAFYYEGLSITQLRQGLEHVLKSDDPSSEYDRWTSNSQKLPGSLREWNVINIDDEVQLAEIWRHIRHNVVVIDYFLNNFVFPKHAKQFRKKMQASGWDIPLFVIDNLSLTKKIMSGSSGRCTQVQTTGFSGTNDNKTMLPLTIRQQDLPGLLHTNAEVLTYLLQPRSRRYEVAADAHGKRLSEVGILQKLCDNRIRVLIDAGAQILEMDNFSLAKAWLKVDYKAPAAVYFDSENKPFVIYRHGYTIPLLASPYADNLGDCLVYLDEAHTRGTDLKLRSDACGALTLGLGQSKDHTVQAAMRLRQLATSQSVMFLAPPEVHQSILDLCDKKSGDLIDSHDVICWLLEQTCTGIEQLQPLYFSQGTDFCRRTQVATDNPDFLTDKAHRHAYLAILQQAERLTLDQLYDPKTQAKVASSQITPAPEISEFLKELNTLRKGFQDNGSAVQGSALQEVEQEREVANEVETVRELQKPSHFSALKFPGLHADIASFATTGRLAADFQCYQHAFSALSRTALGQKFGIQSEAMCSKLFVSTEFTRTVHMPLGRPHDTFLRPVNWILWSATSNTAMIVVPEEAELLIPIVRDAAITLTYLFTYAAPVTRKMLNFNDFKYYTVPALPPGWKAPTWLTIELGIFAGRLYFQYEEYGNLLRYLGFDEVAAKIFDTEADGTVPQNATLYVKEEGFAGDDAAEDETNRFQGKKPRETSSFTRRPLTFLQEWLAVRRKGQDFAHTPLGYICQGKPLCASHPFFSKHEIDGALRLSGSRNGHGHGGTAHEGVQDTDQESVFSGDEMHGGNGDYDEGVEANGNRGDDYERDKLRRQFSDINDESMEEERGYLADVTNRPKKPGA
ncbi:MAG: hypothetical protein MMC33_000887 [Icmadophila ericetorum]|nr:hypothetical protein [Icmadophila ericetorum]